MLRALSRVAIVIATVAAPFAAQAALPEGERAIHLQRADGSHLTIGTVDFEPIDEQKSRFSIEIDHSQFRDHFLSMKEFKCVDGDAEIHCHVAYPYPMPDVVTEDDLRWLEHALLFFYKRPDEFGARLRNGLYYQLESVDGRLQGTPQAIDLDLISAPPEDTATPPFVEAERIEIDPTERAFIGLTIE